LTLKEVKMLLGKDVKVRWKGCIYFPLIDSEKAWSFRMALEKVFSALKFPKASFIGIMAVKKT